MVAVFTSWVLYDSRLPNPVKVVSRAVRVEADFLQQPVHQQFRMEVIADQPAPVIHTSRLEIWSDGGNHRFASTLRREQGELEYAVWQPDSSRHFRYDRKLHEGVPARDLPQRRDEALYSVAEKSSDLETVEKRVEAWISSREWRPISLAADFSLFVNQQGAMLRSERTFSGATPCITVTATSSQPGNRVVMTLQLDAATQQPRLQEIRFQSEGQSFAIRLVTERLEQVPAGRLEAALFIPDVPIANPAQEAVRTIARPPRLPEVAAPPSESDMANAEMKIEYDLHRLGVCTGESIAVSREGDHGITISGVLDDQARKDEVLASLQLLHLAAWVTTKLETLDEAAARINAEKSGAPAGAIAPAQPMSTETVGVECRWRGQGAAARRLFGFLLQDSCRSAATYGWSPRREAASYSAGEGCGVFQSARLSVPAVISALVGAATVGRGVWRASELKRRERLVTRSNAP